MKLETTPSQTVGPYLHIALTNRRAGGCIAGPGVKGERISLKFRLLDGDGIAVPDGMLEIWQANAAGRYAHPEDADQENSSTFSGFGRLATTEGGSCTFETIKPGPVAAPNGAMQAPHLNVSVFGRGLLNRLATRVYFAGEAMNESDPILALVPAKRRHTLMARVDPESPGTWAMEIRLCGEAETVFFDV